MYGEFSCLSPLDREMAHEISPRLFIPVVCFDPSLVHVQCVVDKVTLELVFPRVLRYYPGVLFHQLAR